MDMHLLTFPITCGGWATWMMPPNTVDRDEFPDQVRAALWLSSRLPVSRTVNRGSPVKASMVRDLMEADPDLGKISCVDFCAAIARSGHRLSSPKLRGNTSLSIPLVAYSWLSTQQSREPFMMRRQECSWLPPVEVTSFDIAKIASENGVPISVEDVGVVETVQYAVYLLSERYPAIPLPNDARWSMTVNDIRQNLERAEGRTLDAAACMVAALLMGYEVSIDPTGLSGAIGVPRRIGSMLTARSHRSEAIREARRKIREARKRASAR